MCNKKPPGHCWRVGQPNFATWRSIPRNNKRGTERDEGNRSGYSLKTTFQIKLNDEDVFSWKLIQ
jgi:hypothetical protein